MKQIKLTESKNGSELLLETLASLGIDTVFGYPGGAVLPLYDAIYQFDGVRHILARHEQGALHEAEGYAKSTGKIGVAIVTSGPGATNAITGIADGMSDSVPMLVFTGQVARSGIGKDAFQEADIIGITMPITKYNYQIRDVADIPRIITEAVHIPSRPYWKHKNRAFLPSPKTEGVQLASHQGLARLTLREYCSVLQRPAILLLHWHN